MDSVDRKLTALHCAAKYGHERVVALLLARSPVFLPATKTKQDNRTPLHFAAHNGHGHIVAQLLAHSPELIDARDSEDKTALQLAIEEGHDLVVAQLLAHNPTLSCSEDRQKKQQTVLLVAVEKGHGNIVAQLLAHSPSLLLDSRDMEKQTVLHIAAENGHDHIVAQLLQACDPTTINVLNRYRQTALDLAAEEGHDNIVAQLLARNPIMTFDPPQSSTAIHLAAENGHDTIVAQLLAHSPATVHSLASRQTTALHLAAEQGHGKIVALLLAHNAAVDAVTTYGTSALHLAVFRDCTEVVELLLAHKAAVTDMVDDDNLPLLHHAVKNGDCKIVALLLANDPDLIDVRSRKGKNALFFASNPEIAEMLLTERPNLLEDAESTDRNPLMEAVNQGLDQVVDRMLTVCPNHDTCADIIWALHHHTLEELENGERVVEVFLKHDPELVHRRLSGGTLLQILLEDRYKNIGQEFITKVWRMNPDAVHMVDNEEQTPFLLALRQGLDWAIDLMQWQLSLDDIQEACEQTDRDLERFRPAIEPLLLLSFSQEVVGEYLGFDPIKRASKRPRDF